MSYELGKTMGTLTFTNEPDGTAMVEVGTTSSIELINERIYKASSDPCFTGWRLTEKGFLLFVDMSDKCNVDDFSDEDDYYEYFDVLEGHVHDFCQLYGLWVRGKENKLSTLSVVPDISTLIN